MAGQKLDGADKTAILLMGLGEEIAAEIFRNLSELEVRRISSAMSRLGRIDRATVDAVVGEFHETLQRPKSRTVDAAEFARKLGLPVSAARLDAVDLVDGKTLGALIRGEHPQLIALVVAFCEPKKAGDVLRQLPKGLPVEVIVRLARMDYVAPETIEELNDHLTKEIKSAGTRQRLKVGGADKVAAILGAMGSAGKGVLDQIAQRSAPLAEEIEAKLFTFDDLAKVEDRGWRELLKRLSPVILKTALRNAKPEVASAIYRNMSERAAKLLRDDVTAMGPVRLKDVEEAQAQIVRAAKDLEAAGVITLSADAEYA